MRAYIEKPRTTVGWKGFMYDPNLDGSSNLQLGLENRVSYIYKLLKRLADCERNFKPNGNRLF